MANTAETRTLRLSALLPVHCAAAWGWTMHLATHCFESTHAAAESQPSETQEWFNVCIVWELSQIVYTAKSNLVIAVRKSLVGLNLVALGKLGAAPLSHLSVLLQPS